MAAIADYLKVWHQISNHLIDTADKLVWKWTSDGKFTVRSAYGALHIGSHPIPGYDGDLGAPQGQAFHVARSPLKTVDNRSPTAAWA
jgi:hypothetical protein